MRMEECLPPCFMFYERILGYIKYKEMKIFQLFVGLVILTGNVNAEWLAEENVSRDESQWAYTSYNNARCVAVDTAGVVYVVWHTADVYKGEKAEGIYCCERVDTGWGNPYQVTEHSWCYWPSITADGSGNVHLVWKDGRNGVYRIYYKEKADSGWGSDTPLSDTMNVTSSWYPCVTTDALGNVHVVWQSGMGGDNYEIFYKYKDSTGWHPDERLTQDSANSNHPAIAVDSFIHVVWNDPRNPPGWYYKEKNNGIWSSDTCLAGDSSTGAGGGSITTVRDSCIGTVFADERSGDWEIYYKEKDKTGWLSDVRVTNASGYSLCSSVIADCFGNIHIVWVDWRDGYARVYYKMRDTSGSWSADFPVSASYPYDGYVQTTGSSPSLTCDKSGNVYIVWSVRYPQDFPFTTYSDVYFRMKEADTAGVEELRVKSLELRVYPNPFVKFTTIKYQIPVKSKVSLRIYDVAGRCVKTLIDEEKSIGYYKVKWNGERLSTGIYFAKFKAHSTGFCETGLPTGDYKETKKLILMR